MSTRSAHPSLAEQQERLVRALAAGGDPPPGFDARRLEITAAALRRKRQRPSTRSVRDRTVWRRLLGRQR